jgi:hypothetical protein
VLRPLVKAAKDSPEPLLQEGIATLLDSYSPYYLYFTTSITKALRNIKGSLANIQKVKFYCINNVIIFNFSHMPTLIFLSCRTSRAARLWNLALEKPFHPSSLTLMLIQVGIEI